jgi:hypothetical protein
MGWRTEMSEGNYSPKEGPPDLTKDERKWWVSYIDRLERPPLPNDLLLIRTAVAIHANIGHLFDVMEKLDVASEAHCELIQVAASLDDAAARIDARLGL